MMSNGQDVQLPVVIIAISCSLPRVSAHPVSFQMISKYCIFLYLLIHLSFRGQELFAVL